MARKNRKEKQLRVIKKNHVGASIFLWLVIVAILAGGMISALVILTTSLFDIKITTDYEHMSYVASLYEKEKQSGLSEKDVLSLINRDFLVLNREGKILAQCGENTCSMQKVRIQTNFFEDYQTAWLDQDDSWLHVKDDVATYDFMSILERLSSHKREADEQTEEEAITYATSIMITEDGIHLEEPDEEYLSWAKETVGKLNITFPIWFSFSVLDGQEELMMKCNVSFSFDEANKVLGIYGLLAIFLAITFILMVVTTMRNVRRQKRVINTFLIDPVTKGHNWSWFMIRQEPMLRRYKNAANNYALIEAVLVNYRNFCTCHSLAEGEKLLLKINAAITKSLGKGESCAHVASASFVILMKYENEDKLRSRLRNMIETLENVESTHKFAFHFGVNLLEAKKNQKGRALSRRRINLEEEYNNACTARATLLDSDDSRIAFFDQKLVDEKKWIDQVTEYQEKAVKNEEFVVYYQPKYDPKTRRLRGAEALIRWNSPELGFLPPGRFIPIFEKNGFITEIDHYMLRHVAKDQKVWLDQGLQCVPVSVNVSRAHFIESDLADQIRAIVASAGTPTDLIEIELTESAFFDDKNAMIRTINKLKEYGFKVSMDDFGAGYSSLNSLKDMPLDVLKLDADFFRGESEGGRGEIVVSEAIRLAKNLNMHTVAEGVEEKEQVEFLAKQGCDMIQGFYFAHPLEKKDFEKRMISGIAEGEEEAMPEEKVEEKVEEKAEEKPEEKPEEKAEEKPEEKPEEKAEEKPEEQTEETAEEKPEENAKENEGGQEVSEE